jgi:hypothetical protein
VVGVRIAVSVRYRIIPSAVSSYAAQRKAASQSGHWPAILESRNPRIVTARSNKVKPALAGEGRLLIRLNLDTAFVDQSRPSRRGARNVHEDASADLSAVLTHR